MASSGHRDNWDDEEVRIYLDLWRDDHVQIQLESTGQNITIYQWMADRLGHQSASGKTPHFTESC